MARLLLLAGFLFCSVYFNEAYDFYVGGRNGWVQKPAEKYNSWAERMRFQVKDKIIFNYKKGEDSVLVVDKEDYDSCNTKNPIKRFEDGKTVFVFDRSGPFFFISGEDGHCAQGQKLIVVVMAVRPKPVQPPPSSPITPAPSPAPGAEPPSSSTPSTTPSPSPSPAIQTPSSSPSPAPAFEPPSLSPSPVPTAETPTSSPSQAPEIATPSSSPSPSPSSSSSPATSPASSPVPSQAKSPSPSSASPVAPSDGPGASGLQPPPSSPAPGGSSGGVPAAITPSSNSTSTPTPSSAQILSVSRLSFGMFTLFLGSIVLL